MRRTRKFFCLPPEEKKIFFRALVLLVHSRFLLQFKQFKNVVRYFSKKGAVQIPARRSGVSSERVAALLIAAGSIIPLSSCLSKALAGTVLFHSLGYQTMLHIGVTRENGSLLAHAWLTLDGRVIVGNRSDLGRYKELPFIFNSD